MNNRQMFSIKEAAHEMGLDKKTLREKIKNGEIKVEKRIEGTKEKFFVTRQEVEKYLADNAGKITTSQKLQTIFDNSESMYFGVENLEPIKLQPKRRRTVKAAGTPEATPEATKEIKIDARPFDASELLDFEPPIAPGIVPDAPPAFVWDLGPDNVYDFEPTRTLDEGNNDLFNSRPYEAPNFSRSQATQESTAEIESVLRTISQEYKRRLEEQKQINQFLQLELAHAKRQLLMLPDLQKQADSLYLKEFELAALRKQVFYLKEAYLQATQNVTIQAEYAYVYEEDDEVENEIEAGTSEQDHEKISLLDDSVLPEMDRQIQKIKRVQEAEQSLILDRLKLDATKRQDQNQNLASMKSKIDELENVIATMAEQVQEQKQAQAQIQIQEETKAQEVEQAPAKKPWWKVILGL